MEAITIRNLIQAEIRAAVSTKNAATDLDAKPFADIDKKDADRVFDCLRMEDLQQFESLYDRLRAVEAKVGFR